MKKILTVLMLLAMAAAALSAAPRGKTSIRVGTYDVTNSFNRRSQCEKGTMPSQRMWCNSRGAVADAIIEADCDIMGLQDVCDSVAGRREGVKPLIDIIRERGGDFDWLVLSNKNPDFPLDGQLVNGTGIIWRASRFELRDWGINWLSGIYDKPGRAKAYKYGGNNASMMWVRLYDRQAERELIFSSAGVNGPTQYDKGQKVVYHEINVANCRNVVNYMRYDIVPSGMPSVIAINSRNAPSHEGYKVLTGSLWFDAHDVLHEEGALSEEAIKVKDTCNNASGEKLQGGRPDHILEDGFEVRSYMVLRMKYPTADGSLFYPSLHFPVVAELRY